MISGELMPGQVFPAIAALPASASLPIISLKKKVSTLKKFFLDLFQIRPSQLFLDQLKIDRLQGQFDPLNVRDNMPLPIQKIGGDVFFTDGHTRAYLYDRSRISLIPVYWDETEIDTALYQTCLRWCREEKVMFISDLKDRILSHQHFVEQWIRRCEEEESKKK